MKILQLNCENVKKISVLEIKPDGNLVQITGKNGSGKTSCLDSIYWALAGSDAIQSKPIRKGSDNARIELRLGGGDSPTLIVERRFTETASYLSVKTAEGAKYPSPQKMLDDLLGTLTFDPLSFMRQDGRGQFDVLRRLVKLDVDPDALDAANKADFDARTAVNRDAKAKRAHLATIPILADLPAEPLDESALLDAIETAADGNAKLEQRKAKRVEHASTISAFRNEAVAKREKAAEYQKMARASEVLADEAERKANEMQKQLDEAPALPAPVDISQAKAALNAAKLTNAKIHDRGRREQIEGDAKTLEAKAESLTAAIDARKAQKQAAIGKAAMPVPGLSFGEGVLLYNDLPLDQASDAEQLMVSTAIAAALNPKLRVLRIRDGSLLDDDAMVRLAEFAKERDFQIWVEKVSSAGDVGIVMEDGHVKGHEPQPEAASAAA